MSYIDELYQEVILDHNKKPRNFGSIKNANYHAEGYNPICGDHITVSLNVTNDIIQDIAFEGVSCAICKASASMMTVATKGTSISAAENLINEFRNMATGKLNSGTKENHLGKLKVFAGIRNLPSRVKCALLPWHTLHAALNSEKMASTENSNDQFTNIRIGN